MIVHDLRRIDGAQVADLMRALGNPDPRPQTINL